MPRSTPRPRFSIQIVLIIGSLAGHASGQSPETDGGAPPVDAEDTRAAEQELAEQAQQALLEAQLAQTEIHRLIAERRARLLSVKDDQARFAEQLIEKQADLAAALEAALAWTREHLLPRSASSLRLAVKAVRLAYAERFRRELAAVERLYAEELMPTHDAVEGLIAFLEKRPPHWSDA